MKLNAKKCKVLKVNKKSEARLMVENCEVEEVDSLGANATKDGESTADVRKRITSASFRRLEIIWKATDIGRRTKVSLFKILVLSVLLYGCETWKLTKTEDRRIDTFQTKCKDPQNQMATAYPKQDSSEDGRGRQHK